MTVQQPGETMHDQLAPTHSKGMLQSEDGVVGQSISLECDADCTNSAAPVSITLVVGCLDLK